MLPWLGNTEGTDPKGYRLGIMSLSKKLASNIASLFTVQAANYLIPLVTLPYLVRVLGPRNFGLIAFAQAFSQYFVILTDYGFNLSATREVAIHRADKVALRRIATSVWIIKFFLLAICTAIFGLLLDAVPSFHSDWRLYAVVYLRVVGYTLFPIWLFQGMENMRALAVCDVGSRLLGAAAIFVFVHKPQDVLFAAGLQSIQLLAASIPAWILLLFRYRLRWSLPSRADLWEQAAAGWHVFVSTAAINIYTTSNTFVLGLICGETAVGIFSAANKIVQAVLGLLTPISQSIYPHLSHMAAQSRQQAVQFIRKVLHAFAPAGLLISLLLLLGAAPIVHLALGAQYTQSIAVLRILALVPFCVALSNVFGVQTMLTFGMHRLFSRILLLSAILNLALIVPLARLDCAPGAAFAILITETFVTIAMGWLLHRRGFSILFSRREIL